MQRSEQAGYRTTPKAPASGAVLGEGPPAALRRVSWGALFAGALIALTVGMVLYLLGVAIGAATVDPVAEERPFAGLGIGALIWSIVATLIALFCGGWVAARMAGIPRRADGLLHGLLAWAVATVIVLVLLTTALGRVVGAALGIADTGLDAVARGVATEARDEPIDRDTLAKILAERTQMSQQEARNTVEGWISAARKAPERVAERSEQIGADVADAVSRAALWSFVALVLGALAASAGGAVGAPVGRRRRRTSRRAEDGRDLGEPQPAGA